MIFLILILIIVCLGLMFPKSKIVLALGFFLLFFISTHFQSGNDINNIESSFSSSAITNDEGSRAWAFYSGLLYLNSIGISFYEIRCIDFVIWGSAIYLFIFKFSKFPNYVISCSFLFPLLTFASQMRNGLAVAFLYFAIICLFGSKKKSSGIVLYVLLIIVAGIFHYLGFVYIFGLVALLPISNRKLSKYVIISTISIFFLYNGHILYNLVSLFSPYYANQYFGSTDHQSILNFIILTTGILINYKFTTIADMVIIRHKNEYPLQILHLSNFTSRLNLISLIFLPLLYVTGSTYRLYQNLFILSVALISNASASYITKDGNQGAFFRFVYFCFIFFITAYYMYWQGEFLLFFNSIRI